MVRARRLAKHIERTVTGPMWHGPALLDVLKDLTGEQALAHPLPGAHSIWELVHHVTAWCDIARLRMKGQGIADPTPDQDWPPVFFSTSGTTSDTTSDPESDTTSDAESEWKRAVDRMVESHRQLAADTRTLQDDHLDVLIPGLEYTVAVLLHGIIEHGTYHGGQIALLRKPTA
jgi:uncharacterized damage-inducible protein DinB